MKPLARFAAALRVYAGAHGSSAFELDFGAAQFMVALSAAPARGFSGEGQSLLALGAEERRRRARAVRRSLAWGVDVDPPTLARVRNSGRHRRRGFLQILRARGLVGLIGREQCQHLRTRTPFDLRWSKPRTRALSTRGAALAARGGVRAKRWNGDLSRRARSGRSASRAAAGAEFHCTCLWHARTAGESGPCNMCWPRPSPTRRRRRHDRGSRRIAGAVEAAADRRRQAGRRLGVLFGHGGGGSTPARPKRRRADQVQQLGRQLAERSSTRTRRL